MSWIFYKMFQKNMKPRPFQICSLLLGRTSKVFFEREFHNWHALNTRLKCIDWITHVKMLLNIVDLRWHMRSLKMQKFGKRYNTLHWPKLEKNEKRISVRSGTLYMRNDFWPSLSWIEIIIFFFFLSTYFGNCFVFLFWSRFSKLL